MKSFSLKSKMKPKEAPSPKRDNRMERMSTTELYTFVEASLMTASSNMSKYRTAQNKLDSLAGLEWAHSDLEMAVLGVHELQARLLDK